MAPSRDVRRGIIFSLIFWAVVVALGLSVVGYLVATVARIILDQQ